MSGIETCSKIKEIDKNILVLIVSGNASVDDRIEGYNALADDYLAKPFHIEEVLARLRALIRRSAGHASSEISSGDIILDTRTSKVTYKGKPVKLTSHELRLLSYLLHHPGQIISRTELTEHLYDQDFDKDSNTIEVFVGRLRKKIGADFVETVRGMGYRIQENE